MSWWPFRKKSLTVLDLRYAAETANGIEKYGSVMAFQLVTMLEASASFPRASAIITGIEVPR